MLSVIGCQASTEIRLIEVQVCKGFEVIETSTDDVLTIGTARQVLTLNCKILKCKKIPHPSCKE